MKKYYSIGPEIFSIYRDFTRKDPNKVEKIIKDGPFYVVIASLEIPFYSNGVFIFYYYLGPGKIKLDEIVKYFNLKKYDLKEFYITRFSGKNIISGS